MKLKKNLENGCGWCFDKGVTKHEGYLRKKLQSQKNVSIQCDVCGFTCQTHLGKDEVIKIYPCDTTYYRNLYKSRPNYVRTTKNLDIHPNIIQLLEAKPKNTNRYKKLLRN